MTLNITATDEPRFLRITVTGQFSFGSLVDLINQSKDEADRLEKKHVLIDCLSVVGTMTDVERFQGGQKIAEVFGPRIKVASLVSAEKINKLGELTAVNRGARFLVTGSESEAIHWLISD